MLEDLKFLDQDQVAKSFPKIEALLQNRGQNLVIDLDDYPK